MQDLSIHHLIRALKDRLTPSVRQSISLTDHISDFFFEFFFRADEALPEVVADGAALEEGLEGGFPRADGEDAADVFTGTEEEGGANNGVGWFGGIRVEESQVDVAGGVSGEVGC